MTIQEAIERLSKEKEQLSDAIECSLSGISERNDWGGLVQAIDTVLAELKESKKENSGKWKPEEEEIYWFRDSRGAIINEIFNSEHWRHTWREKNTPIFETREECEKYWHFMDTVKEKSYEFSKEEWTKFNCAKWYIRKIDKRICVDCLFSENCYGAIYFKTKEDAQYIIDNFKDELIEYFV